MREGVLERHKNEWQMPMAKIDRIGAVVSGKVTYAIHNRGGQ